ncbi:two-component system sensor histidine kinase PmrB [Prodigiosinella aquatilis]|nr:two-component system sensor histidine kinase PmrB [Prodigiosinella sp. LS101]WJV53575.1 two-component system sensor histidine kinase PmrB [Prodigiosinella sp. LS101]WJV57935.1 two-component system sensor histidine kinase PmrB [Pectobacteriaceae bacterium C111]
MNQRIHDADEKTSSMRWRLILALGSILLVCQLISVAWLWHESKEQIELLVEQTLTAKTLHRDIDQEIREAIASLSVPSLVMVIASLLMCVQAVNWITRPLSRLQQNLQNRTAENLEPLEYDSNITEIRAVTSSLNQLFLRLNGTLCRDRQFTADVAHELRTPLAGIRLHLELQEQHYQINCQPLINRIDKLTKTVEHLLLLARTGHEFASGHYQMVSLIDDVISPTLEELTEMIEQRHQTLEWQLPKEDTVIKGDATLLQLMLRNLVENAHRYSPENSTITIALNPLENDVTELLVQDQGPGIDENKAGELSKAFVRMDTRYGGIGLGLSIVTRIAQLHQGQFFLENCSQHSGAQARVVFNHQESII